MAKIFLLVYKILLIVCVLIFIIVLGASSHHITLRNKEASFLLGSIIVYLLNLISLFLINRIQGIEILNTMFHILVLGIFTYLLQYFLFRPELGNLATFIGLISAIGLNIYLIAFYKKIGGNVFKKV